jgi:hypothetical protein
MIFRGFKWLNLQMTTGDDLRRIVLILGGWVSGGIKK